MGHSLLGRLPHTKAWKNVIALISVGADAATVAQAVIEASEKAFDAVENDPGFKEAIAYFVEIALAASAKGNDKTEALSRLGIQINNTTPLDLLTDIMMHLQGRFADMRARSDFGDFAAQALVKAVASHLADPQPDLFASAGETTLSRLSELGKEKTFAKVGREAFEELTSKCMEYFLSRVIVSKANEYAKTYGDLVPSFLDIPEMTANLNLHAQLQALEKLINPLLVTINDTMLQAGSDAYSAALSFYRTVKNAGKMNVQNAKVISDDLAKRFVGARQNTDSGESTETTAAA